MAVRSFSNFPPPFAAAYCVRRQPTGGDSAADQIQAGRSRSLDAYGRRTRGSEDRYSLVETHLFVMTRSDFLRVSLF
jgi:hypothetical protein